MTIRRRPSAGGAGRGGRFGRFLAARLDNVFALGLIFVCFWTALALISYQPHDASLNTSTETVTGNWLGVAGAITADLIRQLLGHAGWLALPPLLVHGWRRFRHVAPPATNLQLAAGISAPLLAAIGLALSDRAARPGHPFSGGALGQIAADGIDAVAALAGLYLSRLVEIILATNFILLGLLVMLFAAGGVRPAVNLVRQGALHTPFMIARLKNYTRHFAAWSARLKHIVPVLSKNMPPENQPDARRLATKPKPQTRRQQLRPNTGGAGASHRGAVGAGFESGQKFTLPPLRLLSEAKPPGRTDVHSKDMLEANARMLETVLADFGIKGAITKVRPGPVVTLYELEPAAGVRASRVVGLADDIARSMSAVSARVAPVPGVNAIGIELPNQTREMVVLHELLSSGDFKTDKTSNDGHKLILALGKDIAGAPVIVDLAKMPHLLVAGTTGSGKSVGINTMLLSLLYRLTPDQCRLILVDPKMLELSVYDGIPHLLTPVVTEPKKAVVALKWVVQEMENRYRKMSKIGVRNIDGYNERMAEAKRKGETLSRRVQTGFNPDSGEPQFEDEQIELEILPFIVVVIDEMADLMMVAGKDIEVAVQRLAQMARAAGVHLITATQRPSVDVITGTIKANFPSRVSFQVTSKIDSRTVLGEQGGEQLLGQGDMLFMAGAGRLLRVHGPFVSDEEVEKVVAFLKQQAAPVYIEQVTQEPEEPTPDMGGAGDSLYDQAVAIVTGDGRASTSYLQRRLQIGYNRAARLIEQMQAQGVVSAPNHAGKREILVGDH